MHRSLVFVGVAVVGRYMNVSGGPLDLQVAMTRAANEPARPAEQLRSTTLAGHSHVGAGCGRSATYASAINNQDADTDGSCARENNR